MCFVHKSLVTENVQQCVSHATEGDKQEVLSIWGNFILLAGLVFGTILKIVLCQ